MTRRFILLTALVALLGLPGLTFADAPDTGVESAGVDTAEAPATPIASANLDLAVLEQLDPIGSALFCVGGASCTTNADCGGPTEGYCDSRSKCCNCY